jgi:hypothetical protein
VTPLRPIAVSVGLVVVASAAAGCGLTDLQTARTTPRGVTTTTVAAGVLINDEDRLTRGVSGVPVDVMVRHGATDRLDWGVRLFLGLGALGDVKWNLLDPTRRTAVAISGGLGAGWTPTATTSAEIVHVPVTVSASRAFLPWLTPYAAVEYGAFWVFNYGTPNPNLQYAARTWTGDGVLSFHVGLELAGASGRAFLVEYAYARPVVDDPGDFYKFAVNQFISIGFHTGYGKEPILSR